MDDAENKTSVVPENLKARLKASYDAIGETFTNWTIKVTSNPHSVRLQYLEKLLALLPNTGGPLSVLELGCGAGVPVTEKLVADRPNITITANDISTTQVTLGKQRLHKHSGRVTWAEGDMMSLSFPPGSLDVVLGFYSVFHLPRDEQAVLLERVVKWLRPGGHMLANFPAEDEENAVMEGWMGEKGWVYWSGWGAQATLDKIRGVGLEVLVGEVKGDDVNADFLWVLARKPAA